MKSISLLTIVLAISTSANADILVEDFNSDPLSVWESGWLGQNSNIQNYNGLGDALPGIYLWIDDGDGIHAAGETVEIAFDPAFGSSLTSFSIDIDDVYSNETSVQIYDGSGGVILDSILNINSGYETISVMSTSGISGFSLFNSNSQIEGNTKIDNVVVKTSRVPVPTTIWLFGSGLIGLIGLARQKTHA